MTPLLNGEDINVSVRKSRGNGGVLVNLKLGSGGGMRLVMSSQQAPESASWPEHRMFPREESSSVSYLREKEP